MTDEGSNQADDIHYLLHLEALKRYVEENNDVKRQVEEQVRINTEAKREYQREYQRLADLSQQILLCEALQDQGKHIDNSHVEQTNRELCKSTAIISNKNRPIKLNKDTLKECIMQLQANHKPRCQLAKNQQNFAETRETLKTICTTLENVENSFEAATLMAMDQFSSELQVPDKENVE